MVGIKRSFWIAIGMATLLWLIIWFAYEFHFKYVINEYQKKQIAIDIQTNFWDKRQSFEELRDFSKKLGMLRNLEFEGNGNICFEVYDSLMNGNTTVANFIFAGEDSDIVFLENNEILSFSASGRFTCKDWRIEFLGDKSHYTVERLLAYNGNTIDELNQLEQKLEDINCEGFDKDKNAIAIRFAGHFGEGFEYIIPLTDTLNVENWNKLTDDFYWIHFSQPMFCGWTDW
ncbi:MAG: hypothetical protein Q8K92_20000 [Leadbetterella sp.]|nr:hypothetical protein [Leadbetterella sp.]